jgi:hypothetical protein
MIIDQRNEVGKPLTGAKQWFFGGAGSWRKMVAAHSAEGS